MNWFDERWILPLMIRFRERRIPALISILLALLTSLRSGRGYRRTIEISVNLCCDWEER